MDIYNEIKEKIKEIITRNGIEDKIVKIRTKVLTPEESIGNPEHNDYPLLKGKERLMQAEYKGAKGVAFTDMFGNYEASLYEIIEMDMRNNFRRAIFIATINAILRYTGDIEDTLHCKDEGPVECAKELKNFILSNYGTPKILQVGYQPRFAEVLSKNFELKIVDMDKDNVGKIVNGVRIYSETETKDFIEWADLLFVTGSTFVNDTAKFFIQQDKELVFYGVTCAAPCYLLDLKRYCPYSL